MSDSKQEPLRRVLIASANPLFAKGLQKMIAQRLKGQGEFRLASSMAEVSAALESWRPDLVIVDYDDAGAPGNIQRSAFLSQFITGDWPMQVMLVSLRASGEVVVYDRRTLSPAQAEDWFDLPRTLSGMSPEAEQPRGPSAAGAPPAGPVQVFTTPSSPRSGGMKHFLIAGVLTVILTLIIGFGSAAIGLMPVEASTAAIPVDRMISLQLWLISFLFSLVTVFILYSIVVFRHRQGDRGFGTYFKSAATLEIVWTLIPLGTVIYLAFLGAQDLATIAVPSADALNVKVTAFQWGWSFEYPDTGVISNTLYLPVNRQVHLSLTSRDVIHSFWVPEFRLKQDVLPGANLVKDLRLTPTLQGDYKVRCAELCGGAHAYMLAPVKVVTQQDFDTWMASQTNTASLSPEQRGQKLTNVCMGCHSVDGTQKLGPTWKGLAGSQVKLADGSTVTADAQYLHDSIVNPNKQVVAGFPQGVMPQDYGTTFSDQQIQDIIAYIESLK